MRSHKLNWLFGYQAVAYAIGLLVATGLVPDWGAWYSTSLPYRTQTEALLKGDLAVSRNVADLKFDHTWSEQGVHQVWGLGVPFWRLPFEAAAKICGFDGFPDRIAFGLFALLVCFVVLKVWVPFGEGKSETGDGVDAGWRMITGFGAGFLILLLFPPFLTLLQVRGAVWEEAVAYEYLYGVLQLTLLSAFVRRPTTARLLLVCTLAGLGGMIRPTLVFYGFATVAIATVVWVCKVGQVCYLQSDKERGFSICIGGGGSWDKPFTSPPNDRLQHRPTLSRVLAPVLLGLFLFSLGGCVLWWTNLKRFGDGFEFGHKLNVQYLYGSMHATRFDHPFEAERFSGAVQELFGALFLVEKFNGSDWYQKHIFTGQSLTVRWREFYFRTYDWSFFLLLLFGWGSTVTAWLVSRQSGVARNSVLPRCQPTVGRTTPIKDLSEPSSREMDAPGGTRLSPGLIADPPNSSPHLQVLLLLGFWSLLAALPLGGFYLYAPVISSRYMMDLAPAFAAALAATWLFLASCCTTRWSRALACLFLCVWFGTQIYLSRSIYGGPTSVTAAALKVIRASFPSTAIDGSTTNSHTSDDHGHSLDGNRSDIPFDRAGWNAETGAVRSLVILFVKNPEFLELDFSTQPHPRIPPDPEAIGAKVGLEFLGRERVTKIDGGWRIRFRGPQEPRWRDGLQGAFVATVPKEFLAEPTTPWLLKAVRWRTAAVEDATEHR